MSASAKGTLRKFSRGERRNLARAIVQQLRAGGRKVTFREIWERSMRHRIEGPFPALVGRMPSPVPKHYARAMSNGLMLHPTKGWRGVDGLPVGRRERA